MTAALQKHYRACHLCEAICGLEVEHDGTRVKSIRGDAADPLSRGHVCPKALALQDVHEDPDRLKRPLKRTDRGWEEITWDEAFDEAASRLLEVQRKHGPRAIGIYQGNPTVHNWGAMTYGQLFVRGLGGHYFSATSADQLPRMLSAFLLFGHQLLMPVPDLDRTQFLLVMGGNPLASNGSLMTAPDIEKRLRAIRARGGKLVVVDPRRTETATLADRYLAIRPGADALLLLAMLQTLVRENRIRPGRLEPHLVGLAELEALVEPFAPDGVAERVGIAAEEIVALARDFSDAASAVCYARMGSSTQEFGGLSNWLADLLNIVTGNLDRPGGSMLTRPAVDVVSTMSALGQQGSFDRFQSRVRGLPEFGGELPVSVLAEEIDTPGTQQLRALVTCAGNPVLSIPNGGRLERALPQLEFMLAIDVYLNETTRHAQLILPPTFGLEHDHYDLAFLALAVRNVTRYSPALFERGPDQRHDWEIYLELITRIDALRGGPLRGVRAGIGRWLGLKVGPRALLELGLRTGPHGSLNPFRAGLSLRRLEQAPHGIDLGELQPCLPERLAHPDRKIALIPEVMRKDLLRLRDSLEATPDPRYLLLIGRRDLRSNNSWLHNSPRLVKGKQRCTLRMHPDDAAARRLEDGQSVEVRSRVGSVCVPLELRDEMRPGVVSLPHGWGHHRQGIRLGVAQAHAGASINDLTDETAYDRLSGNAGFNGLPVMVSALGRSEE